RRANDAGPAGDGRRDPYGQVGRHTCPRVYPPAQLTRKLGYRFAWSRTARLLCRLFPRRGGGGRPPVSWRRTGGPWFGNQLMTLTARGRAATLRLEHARPSEAGPRLRTIMETDLSR